MNKLLDVRLSIEKKRGSFCECCGAENLPLEGHHMILHRMKGHTELDCEENIMLVCQPCHQSGVVNSWESRVSFWDTQVSRGYKMKEWLDGLNLKIKPRFE